MKLTLSVEQSEMDAFGRILDAACRSGAAIAPDVTVWMHMMQAAIAEAKKEEPNG